MAFRYTQWDLWVRSGPGEGTKILSLLGIKPAAQPPAWHIGMVVAWHSMHLPHLPLSPNRLALRSNLSIPSSNSSHHSRLITTSTTFIA